MNRSKVLYFSLGLALLAGLFLWLFSQEIAREYGVVGQKVKIVYTKVDIPSGQKVTRDMLTVKEVPQLYAHHLAITPTEVDSILGQVTSHPMREGQPVLVTDFVDPKNDVELDQVVKEGWRALAIPVDKTSSFGGLLRPQDHVDILGTFLKPGGGNTPEERERRFVTITLLQNVTILAVGGHVGDTDANKIQKDQRGGSRQAFDTVTVLVTPQESELLTFALDKGKIGLTLRNENDVTTEAAMTEKSFADIFGVETREKIQKVRNDKIITVVR
ncbi:Flp pilus assembly protein CpaB [Myxococcota bacterium]|nr:Flp pilus assembly protein CpaB [Myxococcota bacterium]